jgi:hypothetical protein
MKENAIDKASGTHGRVNKYVHKEIRLGNMKRETPLGILGIKGSVSKWIQCDGVHWFHLAQERRV